jgi:hypothetical protein
VAETVADGVVVADVVLVGDGEGAVGVGVTTGVGVGVVVGPDVLVLVAVAEGEGGVDVGEGGCVLVREGLGEGEGGVEGVRVGVEVGDVGVAVHGTSAAGSVAHGTAVTTGSAFAAEKFRQTNAAARAKSCAGTTRLDIGRSDFSCADPVAVQEQCHEPKGGI